MDTNVAVLGHFRERIKVYTHKFYELTLIIFILTDTYLFESFLAQYCTSL